MNAELEYFLSQLVNGLALGSMYAMIAVGYSMVYSLLYQVNFAHGDLYVFGTFIALSFMTSNLPVLVAIPLAGVPEEAAEALPAEFCLRRPFCGLRVYRCVPYAPSFFQFSSIRRR